MSKTIMGIKLQNRLECSTGFQSLLSRYGSVIQTRIGLHQTDGDTDSSGLIILDFIDYADSEVENFRKELSAFRNVEVQTMVF